MAHWAETPITLDIVLLDTSSRMCCHRSRRGCQLRRSPAASGVPDPRSWRGRRVQSSAATAAPECARSSPVPGTLTRLPRRLQWQWPGGKVSRSAAVSAPQRSGLRHPSPSFAGPILDPTKTKKIGWVFALPRANATLLINGDGRGRKGLVVFFLGATPKIFPNVGIILGRVRNEDRCRSSDLRRTPPLRVGRHVPILASVRIRSQSWW